MKKVRKTLLTCSFFPNASLTPSASAIIARWISFGRNRKSGRKRTAAPVNARGYLRPACHEDPERGHKRAGQNRGHAHPDGPEGMSLFGILQVPVISRFIPDWIKKYWLEVLEQRGTSMKNLAFFKKHRTPASGCVEQELNLRTPSRRDPKSRSFDQARISTPDSFVLLQTGFVKGERRAVTARVNIFVRP